MFAIVGLIVFAPAFVLVSFMIKREDGGPVFYRGERTGLGGKIFRIDKF